MNREQVESSYSASQREKLPEQNVNLNGQVSPSLLAGILECEPAQIYANRQSGKLPPDSGASLKICLQWYINFLKEKASKKASSTAEAALLQKTKLDRAKTEQAWLVIKRERGELVNVDILAEQFEYYFIHLRMHLCSIARKYPNIQYEIDIMLKDWSDLGKKTMRKSQKDLDRFIEDKIKEEVEQVIDDE